MTKMRFWQVTFSAVLALLVGSFAVDTGEASVILGFSEFSSEPDISASELTADATLTVAGPLLVVEINNRSEYLIAQFYFNTDSDLTGLELVGGHDDWTVSGSGASQDIDADGFGKYNWLIDFGSGGGENSEPRLSSGITGLILNMTGTTSEGTIGSKLSIIPPGDTPAVAAMKFEANPSDESAYGTSGAQPIPEPGTLLLLGSGLVGLVGYGKLRFRRKKE